MAVASRTAISSTATSWSSTTAGGRRWWSSTTTANCRCSRVGPTMTWASQLPAPRAHPQEVHGVVDSFSAWVIVASLLAHPRILRSGLPRVPAVQMIGCSFGKTDFRDPASSTALRHTQPAHAMPPRSVCSSAFSPFARRTNRCWVLLPQRRMTFEVQFVRSGRQLPPAPSSVCGCYTGQDWWRGQVATRRADPLHRSRTDSPARADPHAGTSLNLPVRCLRPPRRDDGESNMSRSRATKRHETPTEVEAPALCVVLVFIGGPPIVTTQDHAGASRRTPPRTPAPRAGR